MSSLARWPAREAFRQDGRAWSYAETADLVSRFAALFQQRGLGRREGVGVLSPNRPEVWMSQTATNVAGGRYTALHPMGSLADHRYACNEAELRFLCVDPAYDRARLSCSRAAHRFARCSRRPRARWARTCRLAAGTHACPLAPGPSEPDERVAVYTGGPPACRKRPSCPRGRSRRWR